MRILALKGSMTEMKSSLEEFNRRCKMARKIISEPVYREVKIIQSEE